MPFNLLLMVVLFLLPMVPTFWAIVDIPKRRFGSTRKKVIWFLVVATLPFLGAVFYLAFVRRHTELIESS
jgi:hypothetical protein